MIAAIVGTVGAISGAFSSYWWFTAARVRPVYNTANLSGPNPQEKERVDRQAALSARAALAAAIAVGCQAIIPTPHAPDIESLNDPALFPA